MTSIILHDPPPLCRIRLFFRYTAVITLHPILISCFHFSTRSFNTKSGNQKYSLLLLTKVSHLLRSLMMGRIVRHCLLATALLGTTTGQGNDLINGSRHPNPAVNTPRYPALEPSMDVVDGKYKSPGYTNASSAGPVQAHRIDGTAGMASTMVPSADNPLSALVTTVGAVDGLLDTTLSAVSDVLTNATLSLLTVCFCSEYGSHVLTCLVGA
jgi:hypothetical protein